MSLCIDAPADDEWDSFVVEHPQGHVLQLSAWGKLKAEFGWQLARTAVRDHDAIVAGAQVLLRRLPLGYQIAYVPKGPLLDPIHPDSCHALFDALRRQNHARQAIMLKVEPDLLDTNIPWWVENGFRPSGQTIQPRRTLLVDITGTEDEILSRMKSKTRYNIRLAERKGVCVHLSTAEGLPRFYRLLQITGQRDGFGIHTQEYYTQAYRCFVAQDAVALIEARYQDQTLAAVMVFAWGKKAWYMYGASSNAERQRMPNHLLQWEAMRWAKARGCETYDLWGIPDVDEAQVGSDVAVAEEQGVLSAGMGGLYRFKRGFGGRVARYVGAWDHVYSGLLYRILTTAWRWRTAL